MAIGSTSTIKDANGTSITVKDVAAEYLIEQLNGTFNRENFRTDESMIFGWTQSFEIGNDKWRYRKLPGGAVICEGSVNSRACTSHSASGGYQGRINFPFTFKSAPAVLTTPVYSLGYPRAAVASVYTTYALINCDASVDNFWIQLLVFGEVA